MSDAELLAWMFGSFFHSDGAWMASFCVTVDRDGLREALVKEATKHVNKTTELGKS